MAFEEHPVQYRAPLYRHLQQELGIPVTVVYKTDASIAGGHDREFGVNVSWDSDLVSGYRSTFLTTAKGGPAEHGRSTFRRLRDQIQRESPRAILLLGYRTSFDRLAILSAVSSGVKCFFRAETTDHACQRKFLKKAVRDALLRSLYGRCSKLLYIGSRSQSHYQRLQCDESKLIFAPYCVDVAPFKWQEHYRPELRDNIRQSFGASEEQRILLFSGKLSYRKGPDLLLAAVSHLPPAVREKLIVVFMGSGEMSSSLKSQASSLGFAGRSHFLGFKNQKALSPYYHAADLLAMPSRYGETWGLVVNEALHHGLPCVVSDAVGSAPDLIKPGESGEISRADSYESFSSAILRALPLADSRQIRDACRRIVSPYRLDAAAKGIATAYASVGA